VEVFKVGPRVCLKHLEENVAAASLCLADEEVLAIASALS
jgi:hypothetical protein